MIVNYIIDQIKQIKKSKPLIVAFDGVDTSGKTTLADMVFARMKSMQLFEPQRIQIDRFHNPREIRIQKGDISPEGFFQDSFDLAGIYNNVINPVCNGSGFVIHGIYDYRTEQKIPESKIPVTPDSVFLFDGIFMNRDELYQNWDLSIFLDVTFETVLERAVKRDLELFGSVENIKHRYLNKYIPGEKIYLSTCHPKERADIVIDNNDYDAPVIVKRREQKPV